jgi:malate permease and related proteins
MIRFIEILFASSTIVTTLLLCVLVGYILRRRNVFPPEFSNIISKLVFYVFLPCMLFSKTVSSITPEKITKLWIFPVSFILYMSIGLSLGYLIVKIFRTKADFVRPVIASTGFSNCGFLPIPLMLTACTIFPQLKSDPLAPQESITFISAYLLGATTLLWTIGYAIISGRSHRDFKWSNLLTPPIIGLFAGTAIGLLPSLSRLLISDQAILFPLFGVTEILSQGTVPCVLLLLGAGLANLPKVGGICKRTVISAIAVKLVIVPVIGLIYIYFLRQWGIIGMGLLPALVLAVEAAMPPANNLIVMTALSDQKAESGLAVLMFWSYLISIFTITLVVSAAIYLFG